MGRLTRDPEIRQSQNGDESMKIARYTLAVDRRGSRNSGNGQPTADFIPCVAFGRGADFAEGYLHQGTKIVVTGRIQTGSYTNKDGVKVYTTDIIVDETEFAESKSSANGGTNADNPAPASSDGFMNIPDSVEDEGLPFN